MVEGGSLEEIADFYDRTDTSSFSWEVSGGEEVIERPDLEQVSIRLPKEDLDVIRRRAAKAG